MNDRVLAGRYRLGSIIGQGGMAVVYRAEDSVLGRQVALKVLREQFAADPEFVERFEREARAAARLSHPAIVQIYDVGVDDGARFIVMELVAGDDLKHRVRQFGALPPAEVIRLGGEIAGALDFAHRKGLIHRDVKPQNVLVDESGHARLTDFGIAQAVDHASITQTGMVMGTAQYMPPEQARGLPTGPASDVYGLGVLLYELATGHLPFPGDNPLAVALRQVEEAPLPPSQVNPSVPPALEATILRALAKDPSQRFASAAELGAALASIPDPLRERTTRVPIVEASAVRRAPQSAPGSPTTRRPAIVHRQPVPPAQPAPRKRGGGTFIVFLLSASLALVALGAVWMFADNRLSPPTAAPGPTVVVAVVTAAPAPTVTVAVITTSAIPAPTIAQPAQPTAPVAPPKVVVEQSAAVRPTSVPPASSTLGPTDTIRQHYALINARRYDDGYQLMSASLRSLNSPAAYRSWFANKVGITVITTNLVVDGNERAVVDAMVDTTDRVGGDTVTSRVAERFHLVLEDGGWRIASVARLG